nr:hypothetical protein CFP56_76054 [Quercus suber]
MAMLKRLSDSFWTFVSSPVKTNSPNSPRREHRTSHVASPSIHRQPADPSQHVTLDGHVRARRSMSPDQRVARWSVGSKRKTEDADPSFVRAQRRKIATDSYNSRSSHRPARQERAVEHDGDNELLADDQIQDDYNAETHSRSVYDDYDSDDEIVVKSEGVHLDRESLSVDLDDDEVRMNTPPHSSLDSGGGSVDEGTTLIVSDAEWTSDTPKRKQVVSLPAAQAAHGFSVPDLQAAGWDDDNIMLRQKIAMRGYEPLLPAYHKFEFRWLPDELFSADGNAFISSCSGNNFRASKALEKLFELGARTRDCATAACTSTRPDQRIRRMIEAYARWAETDAELDPETSVPLFTIVNKRAGYPVLSMKHRALRKLADLAERHRDALTVTRSIEPASPLSATSSELKHLIHPLPTLYVFVTSGTLLTITGWRPSEPSMDLRPIALFNLALQDYDVWNAFAVAIVVHHLRDMRLRIAAQTGVGILDPLERRARAADDDPDR